MVHESEKWCTKVACEETFRRAAMAYSVQQIKYEFLLYMKGLGGHFGEWYVGGSGSPEEALFREHGVGELVPWMYKPAVSANAVRTLLRYFRNVLHTDGDDPEQIDEGARCAYLFRKGPGTSPSSGTGHLEQSQPGTPSSRADTAR